VRIVVSIEAGTATEWQASLLCYSLRRVGERAPVTVLCAGGAPQEPMLDAQVIVHPNARSLDGGDYSPFNKSWGIACWQLLCGVGDETVLILDPDVVALAPLPPPPAPGAPPRADCYPQDGVNLQESTVRSLTRHPELLQAVGIPIWIDAPLLAQVVPGWIERTVAVRHSGALHFGWIAEMVGYQLACADLGISHEVVAGSCGPSLLHYYTGHCGLWFAKSRYRPWNPPPPITSSDPSLCAFRDLLGEYAALRRAG
jgi:hypothetical protein